jgi:hypothetical protein
MRWLVSLAVFVCLFSSVFMPLATAPYIVTREASAVHRLVTLAANENAPELQCSGGSVTGC